MADLFVAGVDEDIGGRPEGTGAPQRESGVEFDGAGADLRGAVGGAAKWFEDGGDLAGGDAPVRLPRNGGERTG